VIDSNLDTAHPELLGMIANTFNAVGTAEKPHAHGTAVAGAIVANSRLKGAAPQARILGVTAFGATPRSAEGTTFSILKGMEWARSQGARIINMSFAGPRDPALARQIAEARKQGIILVAAVGNAGPTSPPLYPASDANVIAVTATDADDKLFESANRGKHIAVAAPGVDVLLPAPEAAYQVTSGTSFAAAEVSGIIALLLERKADIGQDGARKALTATAQDLGPRGVDAQFGAGLVDAYRAIVSLVPVPAATAARRVPGAPR
jgi:subtilisin family serine protease